MNIEIRKVSRFVEVILKYNDTIINLGILDKEECKELALKLIQASYELLDN